MMSTGLCGGWTVLGAAPVPEHRVFESVAWLGLVILVIVAGVGVVAWMRYRILSSDRQQVGPFTLAQLRHLRDRGTLSGSEYEMLRRQAIADLRSSTKNEE